MRNTNKKGFTIVELVIVVAVIAILAAVLIPTFSSIIRKANESKDNQLIKHLNTALAADVDGDETIHAAITAAAEFGFDLAKIDAKVEGNEILWDSVKNVFCYLNDGEIEYLDGSDKKEDDAKYWIIDDEISEKYSTYYYGGNNIKSNTSTSICVVTNGEDLTIDAPNADVYHYGVANDVNVVAVAPASYHVFAEVASLKATKGHIVTEAGSKIQVLAVVGSEVTVKVESSSAEILVVVIDSTNASSIKDAIKDAVKDVVDADAIKEATSAEIDDVISTNKAFADGNGTKENPYIIMTAEQLKNIDNNYDSYAYYKVADGVTSIDCSGWPKTIKLNGSFDGNGVTLTNLSYSLFNVVGVAGENSNVVLKNFTAIINNTAGSALVRNVYNAGKTTFENISLSGTIIGSYNMGSFYNYGTANAGGSEGTDYEVEFINADSSVTLICTSGNVAAGFIGHTFEGAGNGVTISIDKNSEFTGKILTTTGKGHLYFCMTSDYNNANNKFIIGGEEVKFDNGNIPSAANRGTITVVDPQKGDAGYTVAKQDDASYYIVSVHGQVDEYNKDGSKAPNGAGITLVLDSKEMDATTEVLLGNVTSAEIVNDYLDGNFGYTLENGVLKVYVGNRNALSGTIRLQVTQYDSDDNIIATGTVDLYKVEK